MASKICMNPLCSETSTIRWRNGWRLRSGGFVNLCDKCGSAYDQLVFCDTFHLNESGWRECTSCGKRLHCGCIASKSSFELLDSGGVACISCMKSSNPSSIRSQVSQQSPHKVLGLPSKSSRVEKLSDFGKLFASVDNKIDDDTIDRDKLMQFGKEIEGPGQSSVLVTETSNTNGSFGQIKREQGTLPLEAGDMSFSNINQSPVGSLLIVKQDESKYPFLDKVAYESLARPCLNITLGTSNPGNVETCNNTPGTPNLTLPIPATVAATVAEGREQSKGPVAFPHGQRSRHILPKPPNTSPSTGSDSSKDVLPQLRVARPPGEGRGRNQLLPRYWPRITDQELQQISGDSNSTIVPLFEKVLSASDAGRIGRLVLPKACAEAYFPPISQPEGLPLKIQDAKGKDWIFQFRFWPNNNSRMYVLEGVTPCIQSMQLQAGDTVTFSRIDPEGKLVMGFRKATNSLSMQDTQISATSNGGIANETFITGVLENLHSISAYSGLLHSLKGGADPHLSTSFEQINPSETDTFWHKTEKHGGRLNKVLPLQSIFVPEKKRSRNLSSKSKRLLIDNEDALELKLTWEEAQDLLRPPPSVKPSIVVIEDHEFEEYEEPPVFGKRTIFTTRPSGGHDQWAQCDNCYRWRRLPVDALLPPRWTCSDNEWDPRRCSCSAPDEMSSKELEDLLRLTIDFKKRKAAGSRKSSLECEVSGLDALATVAVLGDGGNSMSPSISATTTKHPRHRPGCTCIVCIQPPSGKGPKHKPTCTCNVCMTVKRRFKTLMMRKKKRQSEREAETARKKLHVWGKDEAEVDSTLRCQLASDPENEVRQANTPESGQARTITEKAEIISNLSGSFKEDIGKGGIDLNCHPDREEDLHVGSARASMMNLLRMASLPLETYLKQHGLTSLVCEQQASSSSQVPPLGASESEGLPLDESFYTPVVHENAADESVFVPDHAQNDTL